MDLTHIFRFFKVDSIVYHFSLTLPWGGLRPLSGTLIFWWFPKRLGCLPVKFEAMYTWVFTTLPSSFLSIFWVRLLSVGANFWLHYLLIVLLNCGDPSCCFVSCPRYLSTFKVLLNSLWCFGCYELLRFWGPPTAWSSSRTVRCLTSWVLLMRGRKLKEKVDSPLFSWNPIKSGLKY